MNAREMIHPALWNILTTEAQSHMNVLLTALEKSGFVILHKSEVEAMLNKALDEAAGLVEQKAVEHERRVYPNSGNSDSDRRFHREVSNILIDVASDILQLK